MTAMRGPTLRFFLKGYLLIGLVLIAVVIGAYTWRLTRQLERQAELTTSLIASIAGPTLFSETPDLRSQQQLQQVIAEVDFPFIFTNNEGRPIIWNAPRVGIPLPDSFEQLLAADLESPADPALQSLLSKIREFDRDHEPIPLMAPGGVGVSGQMHYGSSGLSRRLLMMPWLEAALIVSFMGVVLFAFRNMKRSEQRSIWVGMAKETAHQMGTPLTSLNGWLALLRDEDALENAESSGMASREQVLTELQRDTDRLAKVSARFSQIGSQPRLAPGRVDELALQVCNYFRTRLPHLGKQVRIETRLEEVPTAPINAQLLDWALENLLKNALDALDKGHGLIEVHCREHEGQIELIVSDNGKGMSSAVQKRIFQPGFSTKQRGWGMGLVLVHRIIVEYHGGHIEVLRSVEGEGSTFRLLLPAS